MVEYNIAFVMYPVALEVVSCKFFNFEQDLTAKQHKS